MFRKALVIVALALTVTAAFAQSRGRAIAPFPLSGNTVSGIVTAFDGKVVSLAGGLVQVDTTSAKVIGAIIPGSLIFATLSSSTPIDGKLVASMVGVTNIPDVTLTGPVTSIDTAVPTITLLGQTIRIDSNTSFGGGHDVRGLTDIVVGDTVVVEAHAASGSLTATKILVFAPVAHMPVLIHGTVKSIGTSSWVITESHGKDITVNIDAQTKIIGSPKAGDEVEVLANVDSANNYVAISILAVSFPQQMHLTGVVKSISPTQWVIGPAVGLGPDFLVQVNAQTKIVGDPHVGDHVDVVVQPGQSGFVAISITKT